MNGLKNALRSRVFLLTER
jgi:hypothetical protein